MNKNMRTTSIIFVMTYKQSSSFIQHIYKSRLSQPTYCTPAARHTNIIFAHAAFLQLASYTATNLAQHTYNKCFGVRSNFFTISCISHKAAGSSLCFFLTFVRLTARNVCLTLNLEAYSNDPHENRDAVDHQSRKWKEDHLAPNQMDEDFKGLDHYQTTIGSLLKYVRGHVRDLLLTNVLETVKIQIKGDIPPRKEMLVILYADLSPPGSKTSKKEIQKELGENMNMQIQMTYMRLAQVYHYKHKLPKNTQWAVIDKQLMRILRGSSPAFQHMHAKLVLAKDTKLFSGAVHIRSIPEKQLSVPSLDNVRAAMALDSTAGAA
ncbi:hypothetical protein MJO29_015682 [Puccinia striiformis f. sp. tritici]|nr:hypothetical protein MJO29_015682 [Puccinia striiformis f. sp. tritici]